ncbi:MAG TPA: aminotransferase class IV, partial [Tepidisphaeraceae bacterium]|nr:aminotransferase class IV [Tepidisphaeraceae bacterium]
MALKVWIDGQLYDKENAKVSVYDHGFLYGDGVFEGIRVYNGRIFEPDTHIRRLFESAKAIRLTLPLAPEKIRAAIEQTVKANAFTDCYVRLIVTRGVGYLGLNPNKCANPSVVVITDTIEMYPPEMYEKGMSVITSSV